MWTLPANSDTNVNVMWTHKRSPSLVIVSVDLTFIQSCIIWGNHTIFENYCSCVHFRIHIQLRYWSNGVRQELKFQMALQHKSGLFHIQWLCRFRTLANIGFIMFLFFVLMFYLVINKLHRKWVTLQLVIQYVIQLVTSSSMWHCKQRWYATFNAQLVSQHHLLINVDLSNPVDVCTAMHIEWVHRVSKSEALDQILLNDLGPNFAI